MASFKIEQIEEKSDITNVKNYEIVKKAFRSMFKDSLELARKLLEGQEEKDDFQQRFKKLVQEIFEERLKVLEKFVEKK